MATDMAEYLLKMANIRKTFGAVRALAGVNLAVREGEIHAVVGENGAGKSTLMKILDGYYPYGSYEGEVILDGRPVRLRGPRDAARCGIAMIYQEIAVHPNLGVAENVFLGHLPARGSVVAGRTLAAKAREALAQVGLDVDVRQAVSRLGASQQQLLMIAKALVLSPRLLVLDEPTSALTIPEVANLHGIVASLKRRGVTCIYISHKLDEVFRIADGITVLRDGQAVRTFERQDFDADRVIEAMVGRPLDTLYAKAPASIGPEVLRVENLSVPHPRVRGRHAVERAGLSVRRGEILGVAGLVGSGRSELLGAIYGSVPRSSGDLYLGGERVFIRSPRQALANGIAMVTEDRHKTGLIPGMSVARNITLASLPKGWRRMVIRSSAEKRVAAEKVAELQVKIPSVAVPVRRLSGGNQQKVVLAKCLLTRPKVLLLDDPTRGIDVGAKHEIYRLIFRLAAEGAAIVLVSSELPELLRLADRFIVLAAGRVVDEFPKSQATENRVMAAATGVREPQRDGFRGSS